jgi:hypothetical protein
MWINPCDALRYLLRALQNASDSSFPQKREPRKIKALDYRLGENDGFFRDSLEIFKEALNSHTLSFFS